MTKLELLREKTQIKLILPNDLDQQFIQCEIDFEIMKNLLYSATKSNKCGTFTEEEEMAIQELILKINGFKFFQ